jgi:hypothetical protein
VPPGVGDRHPGCGVELGGVAGSVGKPGGAAAGEGGDGPGGGVDGPDPMVIPVGDVDGAAGGDRHPERVVELGGVAGSVGKADGAAGEGGDGAGGGVDGPDPMVVPVGDVDGAAGGDRHPGWVVELGGVAGPSANPAVPLPARVVTSPVVGLMARIRWLLTSPT